MNPTFRTRKEAEDFFIEAMQNRNWSVFKDCFEYWCEAKEVIIEDEMVEERQEMFDNPNK